MKRDFWPRILLVSILGTYFYFWADRPTSAPPSEKQPTPNACSENVTWLSFRNETDRMRLKLDSTIQKLEKETARADKLEWDLRQALNVKNLVEATIANFVWLPITDSYGRPISDCGPNPFSTLKDLWGVPESDGFRDNLLAYRTCQIENMFSKCFCFNIPQ
jgi:hypothetical protein